MMKLGGYKDGKRRKLRGIKERYRMKNEKI